MQRNIKELETIVLTVNKSEESVLLPNSRLVREFVLQHYPKAEAIILKGDAGQEITAYLKREKSYPLVVMGAYQRSKFSRAFRPSMADHLLQHVEVPLFIAHNKS